jgi:hypothetical protein
MALWQGAKRSDTGRYDEDLQRRHGAIHHLGVMQAERFVWMRQGLTQGRSGIFGSGPWRSAGYACGAGPFAGRRSALAVALGDRATRGGGGCRLAHASAVGCGLRGLRATALRCSAPRASSQGHRRSGPVLTADRTAPTRAPRPRCAGRPWSPARLAAPQRSRAKAAQAAADRGRMRNRNPHPPRDATRGLRAPAAHPTLRLWRSARRRRQASLASRSASRRSRRTGTPI